MQSSDSSSSLSVLTPAAAAAAAAGAAGDFSFSFSQQNHSASYIGVEQGAPSSSQGPWIAALEPRAQAEDFLFIDYQVVPCTPLTELRGLCFLSPNANDQLKSGLREDVLVPSDTVDLCLFQARSLMHAGKVKIRFPAFFGAAITSGLIRDPLGIDVSRFSEFYFELGEELCRLLPEDEWPCSDILNILRSARQSRRVLLLTSSVPFDRKLMRRLTFEEKEIPRFRLSFAFFF
ncbi:hypothetical protein Esti_001128 [Eimeria stiedai]